MAVPPKYSLSKRLIPLGATMTPSLLYNNLTNDGAVLAFAHKTTVYTVPVRTADVEGAGPPPSASPSTEVRAVPKVDEGAAIMQVSLCNVHDYTLLVVCTTVGVQVWRADASAMVAHKTLADLGVPAEEHSFARGITSVPAAGAVFVGSSTGHVASLNFTGAMTFAASSAAAGHSEPVSCMGAFAKGTTFLSGSDDGSIKLWDAESLACITTFPPTGDPCTSVVAKDGYAVASFTTGHIRLYDLTSKSLAVEIAAHARCITALDMHPSLDMFVAVSEGASLSLWSVPGADKGATEVELLFTKTIDDQMLTGVQFLKTSTPHIVTSAYDVTTLSVLPMA